MKFWSIESKAFLKSIARMRLSIFFLFTWLIRLIRLIMQDPIILLLT